MHWINLDSVYLCALKLGLVNRFGTRGCVTGRIAKMGAVNLIPGRDGNPFLILRLWPQHHREKQTVDELIRTLRRHRRCCDEVWFCTEAGFPRLEVHRASARRMARAAAAVRAAGFRPGLQIANIVGHTDGALSADGMTWQRLVGHDGRTARRCSCPRAPRLHDYLRAMLRAYAAWQPSSVWIDDDLRMQFHPPVEYGCFCDTCLAAFSAAQRRPWNRQQLADALLEPNQGALRLAWTRFHQDSLALLARVVAETVHAVAPGCRLGLQHAGPEWGLYNGPDLKPVFAALADATGAPVGSRPGGAFYNDHQPREMLSKGYVIARQVARLPPRVSIVCAEIENFTHTAMGKSAQGTLVESTLDLALGCNALAYAILCSGHESMEWYAGMLRRIAAWRPFWERCVAHNAGTVPGGLEVPLGYGHVARRLRPGEGFRQWTQVNLDRIYRLATLGLPLSADHRGACATLLCAEVAEGLSATELRKMLSGGVLADGAALARLQTRRLGAELGVRAVRARQGDAVERFTGDPINGVHEGYKWQQYPFGQRAFWFRLKPTASGARILGHFLDVRGRSAAPASVAVETALGGRLVVFGNNGWDAVVSTARRAQLLAAADWVSRGRLPVIIETAAQVVAVPRIDGQGRLRSLTLLNVSIDASPPLRLRLRGVDGRRAEWLVPPRGGRRLPLRRRGTEVLMAVPSLPAWSIACALF